MRPDYRKQVRTAALIVSGFTLIGLFQFGYRYLGSIADGSPRPMLEPLVDELTGAWAAILIFLIYWRLVPRYPITRANWPHRFLLWAVILVPTAAAHTVMMAGSRAVLYPLVGLGPHDYGNMAWRFPMEFFIQAIMFSAMIGFLHFWHYHRRAQARELQAAHLETQLGQARLQALQAQLQPHFLFNTMNAITSLMYEDPAAADRMMARLSDLLRLTLGQTDGLETPLRDELVWLAHYLEIMQVRFGERLRVRIDVTEEAGEVRVPRLLLQPLVENAIRHGVARRPGAGTIEIAADFRDGRLHIEVRDDGPGIPAQVLKNGSHMSNEGADHARGIGLANTRERLRHAYGDRHSMTLSNRASGGAIVALDLPVAPASVSHE